MQVKQEEDTRIEGLNWYYNRTFRDLIRIFPIGNERQTFLIQAEELNKYVVIKRIKINNVLNGDDNFRKILTEEYFLACCKKNRYFVEIIDVLYSVDFRYIFFILKDEGVDLQMQINNKDFDYNIRIPDISRHIIFQVVCGLKYLHDKNLSHNDIKPGNIVVSKEGKAKICDMGSTGQVSRIRGGGTNGYLSPQALLGKERTKEDDMWSVGVVFLELLIQEEGIFSFEKKSHVETLKSLLKKFYDIELKAPRRNDDIYEDIIEYIFNNYYESFEYKLKNFEELNNKPYIYNEDKKLIQDLLEINPSKRLKAGQVLNLPMFRMYQLEQGDFIYKIEDYDKYLRKRIPDLKTFLKYLEEIKEKFIGFDIFI